MTAAPFAVEVKIIDPRIRDWGMPSYQTQGSAAIDLFACIDAPMAIAAQAPAVLIPYTSTHLPQSACLWGRGVSRQAHERFSEKGPRGRAADAGPVPGDATPAQ